MFSIVTNSFSVSENPVVSAKFCAEVRSLCSTAEGANLFCPTLEQLQERCANVFVAAEPKRNEIIAGCYTYVDGNKTSHISAVFTNPEFRRNGVSKRVVGEAIANSISRGHTKMKLVIRLTNEGLSAGALALYVSVGFVLQPGINVANIGWDEHSRHLWVSADPDGTFRSRIMSLDLTQIRMAA